MIQRDPADLNLTPNFEARCRLVVVERDPAWTDVGFDFHELDYSFRVEFSAPLHAQNSSEVRQTMREINEALGNQTQRSD